MNKGLLLGGLLATILTASVGRITFNGHSETYYSLPMKKVIQKANNHYGVQNVDWVADDGCKMYGPFVIVAADYGTYPYGTIVGTSRGLGIVLDTHTASDRSLIDIATTWRE